MDKFGRNYGQIWEIWQHEVWTNLGDLAVFGSELWTNLGATMDNIKKIVLSWHGLSLIPSNYKQINFYHVSN